MRSVLWAFVIALAFFGLALTLPACMGPDPTSTMSPSIANSKRNADGLIMFGEVCEEDAQCESGLCTQFSYHRKPAPICTYRCDNTGVEPPPAPCVHGCNKQGYCRVP